MEQSDLRVLIEEIQRLAFELERLDTLIFAHGEKVFSSRKDAVVAHLRRLCLRLPKL